MMFHESVNGRSGDASPDASARGFSSVNGSTASVGDNHGSSSTNTGIYRNRKRNIHGEIPSESPQAAVPLNELTEMNQLIAASIQQNTSLVELCQELKSDVAQLRKEFNEIKETISSSQEVKSDVAQLKKEFNEIKGNKISNQGLTSNVAQLVKENKISYLELNSDVAELKKEFTKIKENNISCKEFKSNVAQLRKKFNGIKESMINCQELRSDIAELKKEFSDTKESTSSCQELKSDIAEMRREFSGLKEGISGSNSKEDSNWVLVKKPNKRLPRDLTKLVRQIHSTLESQYIGEERYNSRHNHAVSAQIIQQITTEHKDKYHEDTIRAAAHRYYESRRRRYNDSLPERQEQVKKVKDTAQRKVFRKRIYERRMKMLDNQREQDYWLQITYEYMTEESEDEEGEYIRLHKLSWTSHSLQKLKHKLDERWKARESTCRGFKSIKRVESTVSALPPPKNPVKWAVSMTSNSSEAVLVESSDEISLATPSVIPIDSSPSNDIHSPAATDYNTPALFDIGAGNSDGFMCDDVENEITRCDVGMTRNCNGFICDDGADRNPRRPSYSIVDYSSDSEDDCSESDWSSPEE